MPTFGLREPQINTLHAFWRRVAEDGLTQLIKVNELADRKRPAIWPIVATQEEVQSQATYANALGGVVIDGIVIAGEKQCIQRIEVRQASAEELGLYYASGLEQLGLTEIPLRSDGKSGSLIMKEWDRCRWAYNQITRRLSPKPDPSEKFHDWDQRRLTTHAIVGAEQIARLIAATQGLAPRGIGHLESQMLDLAERSPGRESWRLEQLARATRPQPGPLPRQIAPGWHEPQQVWAARVQSAFEGIAWWLRHGDTPAGRVSGALAVPHARRGTVRWITGAEAQKQNAGLHLGVRNANDTVRARIEKLSR